MKTHTDVDYVPAFTFTLNEPDEAMLTRPVDLDIDTTAPRAVEDETSGADNDTRTGFDEATTREYRSDFDLKTVGAVGTTDEVSKNDVGFFMALAGRFGLLGAERERVLGFVLWFQRKRILRILREARMPNGARYPELRSHLHPITPASRRRLFRLEDKARRWLREDSRTGDNNELALHLEEALRQIDSAKTELVEHNLRLVIWVAKSFRGRGFDFIDLIQEGNLGLMRAIDRFDPVFGARFSTFATHWIRQGIRRALAEKARAIRIPVNRIGEVRETLRAQASLRELLGRRPTELEVAREIGQRVEKVKELLPAIAPIDSIDAPVASSDRTLSDTIADLKRPTPLDSAIEEETVQAVKEVLDQLPDRQRVILSMRHGIDYPKECTLEEIGVELGLSRERIRQVEKQAAHRVRSLILQNRPKLAEV